MYLTEKYHLPSFSTFRTVVKRPVPINLDLICRSFDENMLRRLESFRSISKPAEISLSWLSSAVDFLSSTHDEAQILISDLKASCAVSDDSYLNHSVKLLDLCNLISSEIERLRQRRLLINFVLHLLRNPGGDGNEGPAADKIRRAGESLADLENNSHRNLNRKGFHIQDPEALVRDLAEAVGSFPHGKVSSAGKVIQRTIFAVGLVTLFVAGVAVSALYGLPATTRVQVPGEFVWANSFNDLQSSTFDEMKRQYFEEDKKRLLTEANDVGTSAKKLRQVINGTKEEMKEKLETAVKELEKAKEAFSEGVDGLSNVVDGFFHKVLDARSSVLDNYRLGNDRARK